MCAVSSACSLLLAVHYRMDARTILNRWIYAVQNKIRNELLEIDENVQFKIKSEMNCSKSAKMCSSNLKSKRTAPNQRKSAVQNKIQNELLKIDEKVEFKIKFKMNCS